MDVSTTPSTANTCFKQQFAVTAPLLWERTTVGGTFPSASLAWRMSEEKFIKDLNVFDDLKFRVGYGVSGNSLRIRSLFGYPDLQYFRLVQLYKRQWHTE